MSDIRCFAELSQNQYRFIQEIDKGARPLFHEHARGCTNGEQVQQLKNLWPLFQICWGKDPAARPNIKEVRDALRVEWDARNIQNITVCVVFFQMMIRV